MTTESENQNNLYELKGRIADAISLVERELRHIGASGKGIKELVNSIENQIPYEIKRDILWCNKVRNQLIHPDENTGYIRIPTEKEYGYFRQNIKKIMDYFIQQKNINSQRMNNISSNEEKDEVSSVLSNLDNAWSNLSLAGKILTVAGSIVALPFLAFGYYWLRDKLDI